jgi:hypothetical protein
MVVWVAKARNTNQKQGRQVSRRPMGPATSPSRTLRETCLLQAARMVWDSHLASPSYSLIAQVTLLTSCLDGYPNFQSNVRPAQGPTSSPPNIDMINAYQRDSQQLLSQHPTSYPEYQQYQNPTPYSTPQMPNYTNFGNQYAPSSSYSGAAYIPRSEQQHAQPQPSSQSQSQQPQQAPASAGTSAAQQSQYTGSRAHESGSEHSDTGVAITASY